jgi:hypothetical protein
MNARSFFSVSGICSLLLVAGCSGAPGGDTELGSSEAELSMAESFSSAATESMKFGNGFLVDAPGDGVLGWTHGSGPQGYSFGLSNAAANELTATATFSWSPFDVGTTGKYWVNAPDTYVISGYVGPLTLSSSSTQSAVVELEIIAIVGAVPQIVAQYPVVVATSNPYGTHFSKQVHVSDIQVSAARGEQIGYEARLRLRVTGDSRHAMAAYIEEFATPCPDTDCPIVVAPAVVQGTVARTTP